MKSGMLTQRFGPPFFKQQFSSLYFAVSLGYCITKE
jgi:hypothetical protein